MNNIITNVKWQFMIPKYEYVEFIAINERLIDKLKISSKNVCANVLANKEEKKIWVTLTFFLLVQKLSCAVLL